MNFSSFSNHTLELKARVVYTSLSFLVTWSIFFYYAEDTLYLLMNPLLGNDPCVELKGQHFIFTKVTEAFFTELKFSFFLTFFWLSPLILYQVWLFSKPGLYPKESKVFSLLCVSSISLFFFGLFFGYTFILPIAWHFFTSFEIKDAFFQIRLEAKISDFVELASTWIFLVGILFQYPIFLATLLYIGWVSPKTLVERRKLSCLFAFIIAACFSPPDIASQVLLALPLLLFYESAIFTLILQEKFKRYFEIGNK